MSSGAERDAALLAELDRLRHSAPEIRGCLLAGADGLLIVGNAAAEVAEGVAALSAACLGVSQRVADTVGHHGFKEVVIASEDGHVAMYRVGDAAVLVILAAERANVGRLHHEARRAAPALLRILTAHMIDNDHGLPPFVDATPSAASETPRRASARR